MTATLCVSPTTYYSPLSTIYAVSETQTSIDKKTGQMLDVALKDNNAADLQRLIDDNKINETVLREARSANKPLLQYLVESNKSEYPALEKQTARLIAMMPQDLIDQKIGDETAILRFAKKASSVVILDALIERGQNVNDSDKDGITVLMRMINNDTDPKQFESLCRAGVQIYAQDKQGRTALMHAIERDEKEWMNLIRGTGVDDEAFNQSDAIAREFAIARERSRCPEGNWSNPENSLIMQSLNRGKQEVASYLTSIYGSNLVASLKGACTDTWESICRNISDSMHYTMSYYFSLGAQQPIDISDIPTAPPISEMDEGDIPTAPHFSEADHSDFVGLVTKYRFDDVVPSNLMDNAFDIAAVFENHVDAQVSAQFGRYAFSHHNYTFGPERYTFGQAICV